MSRLLVAGSVGIALMVACQSTTGPDLSHSAALNTTALPLTATISFGLNDHSSPFPPQQGHDHSTNAADNLVPRTVVIGQGGSVTFEIDPVHQAAVYQPGILPGDIQVNASTLEDVDLGFIILPNFRINDPNGRLALAPAQALTDQSWTTPAGTFDQPGTYLVICTTLPHFAVNKMYGWVIVQ